MFDEKNEGQKSCYIVPLTKALLNLYPLKKGISMVM
jgi:hypothetical protein